MKFVWSEEKEKRLLELRSSGASYSSIAKDFGTSLSSVKHKARRLQQANNDDRYKHTAEKTEQALRILNLSKRFDLLETHSGYGGMTEFYSRHFNVTCFDIDKDRINYIKDSIPDAFAFQADSEKKIIELFAGKRKFSIIDIDPYGLPSRFFPYVFGLIDEGYLFLTFPVMGVSQMNKITIRHYQAFWGIELNDNPIYVDKIKSRLKDYAFMMKRDLTFIDVMKIDRIYRFAIKVEKKSLLDIVGLEVNRGQSNDEQRDLFND